MAKEITLNEMRQIQLDILQKIDQFCRDNELQYSLSGGTLIGAVRHQGYIPWDDDIDIMMPRNDYEKFWKKFQNKYNHLKVQNYITDKHFSLWHTKVYDNRTYLVSPWEIDGVFVDVFAVDGIPSTKVEQKKYFQQLYKYKSWVGRCTKLPSNVFKEYTDARARQIRNEFKILTCPFKKLAIKRLHHFLDKYPFETSEYAGAVMGMYGERECMKADVFRHYIELPFEDRKFKCVADYNTYLTHLYGDYMQLPPEEKRKTHHQFKVYWKE